MTYDEESKNDLILFKEVFANFDWGTTYLPSGINNIQIDLNVNNIGSIIAFALSSNIYIDGLVN